MANNKKLALVTGANKGIGLEISRQLAQLGYEVLMGSRDLVRGQAAAKALQADGLAVHAIHLDLKDANTFDAARQYIETKTGHLDALVNNAGTVNDFAYNAANVPPHLLRETFESNFFAQVDLTQRLLPLLRKSAAGRIVNQSSVLGSLTLHSMPNSPLAGMKPLAYNSSKTALNAFTVHLADALRDTAIKVNSAHPGSVVTDMNSAGTLSPLRARARRFA